MLDLTASAVKAVKLNNTTEFVETLCAGSPLTLLRYVVLDNGLRALLISDYSGPAASGDEDSDGEDEGEEEEEEEDDGESGEESEDQSEEEEEEEDEEDDDKEGKKKKGNAEKQVGQFPAEIHCKFCQNVMIGLHCQVETLTCLPCFSVCSCPVRWRGQLQ